MGHAELGPEDIDESISPLHGALKRTWASFCATTSIHGLKYIHDEDTNKAMRFVWLLITLSMLLCAIVMVYTFYVDYRSNPIRMNVENDHAPIENLFFPAITVCPEVLYNTDKALAYLGTLRLPPDASPASVFAELGLSYGFMNDDVRFEPRQIDLMQGVLRLNNLTAEEFVGRLRWGCDELMHRCRYRGRLVACAELFQVSRAFFGHCCSFNLNQTGIRFTGSRATHHGLQGGLSLALHYGARDLEAWRSYSRGFKLLLHETNAFPSAHAVAKFVAVGEEVFLSVRPVEIFCSPAVRGLAVEERQCVFPHEFPLRHFEAYAGANCELNCRVQNMVRICGCLTFFFNNRLTADRVCTFTDIPCLVENFAEIIGRQRNTQCPCPKSCETIDFDVQLTGADLQPDVATVDEFYQGIGPGFSVAHIFMNSQVYRRVKTDLLSNTVTLVSNLGSAFSLFVGMSMVSGVEILYYFSVILRKLYRQEVRAREQILFTKAKGQQMPVEGEEDEKAVGQQEAPQES